MTSFVDLRALPIKEALSCVPLSDPEHAILAGARAIEVHVGRQALLAARKASGAAFSGDIDLIVSRRDYTHLQKVGAYPVWHMFRSQLQSGKRYRRRSLAMFDRAIDIWRERWYEPARYPNGVIGIKELVAHSEWNEAQGVRVLTVAYLIAQRRRSVQFLEGLDGVRARTPQEEERLCKDRADLGGLEMIGNVQDT